MLIFIRASQVPAVVIDNIKRYMSTTYVQLGAGYPLSTVADQTINDCRDIMSKIFNAGEEGKVIIGKPFCICFTFQM